MTRQPSRVPPGGSAVDRLAALVERSIADLSSEISRVQSRVIATDERTDASIRDLIDEFRRESTHLNDRMERFHEAAQLGIEQVRAELRQHERSAAEGAARGAAEGATKAASEAAVGVAQVAAKAGLTGFLSTWTGRAIAAGVSFTAAVTAIKNIPAFVRGIDAVWHFLGGKHG